MASLGLLSRAPASYPSSCSTYAHACSPSLSALHLLPSSPPPSSSFCVALHVPRIAVSAAAASSSSIQELLRADSSTDDSFGSSLFSSLNDVVPPPVEPKPAVECPPGLCRYETMAVLRPDITEEQRLELTQRYEEAIIAGGGMGVEAFNRGMMPLAYNIRRKDMGGISNRYLDGVYFLFTYCAKPNTLTSLQKKLNTDDDVIRSSTFKIKPSRPS